MSIMIDEKDRTCINCKYGGMDWDNPQEPCKECCNGWYGEKYTENHFTPDDDFIRWDYADCSNCKHQDDWNGKCATCKRLPREDNWEAG